MRLNIYIDGTAGRSYGAGVGVYIEGNIRYSAKIKANEGNVAEYTALLHALKLLDITLNHEIQKITIHTDSTCLTDHTIGKTSPENGELQELMEEIDEHWNMLKCHEIEICHLPKKQNTLAHSLAKKGAKL